MDVSILRLVIFCLSAICGLCISGIILAASLGHEIPPTLGSISSMVAGALVGILVTPSNAYQRVQTQQQQYSPSPKQCNEPS